MDKIVNLLKTPEGAQALKAKLKAMPAAEKAKPNYANLWKLVCEKVDEYNLKKMKEKQANKQPDSTVQQAFKTQKEQSAKPAQTETKKPEQTNTQKPKKKNNKKPHQFNHCKYSEQDIIAMMERLEHHYPKLFNAEHPKPFKVGIFEDIVADGEWDAELLKEAIRKYVKSEAYYLSFTKESSRYNLNGESVSAISQEDVQHAIDRFKKTVGRFNMPDKYPEWVAKEKAITPEPIKSKFYGMHYYEQKRFFEIKTILTECYGSSIKIKHKDSKVDGLCHSVITVNYQGELLFNSEAKAKEQKAAQKLVSVKLLVHLQNTIEAYPFPYKKSSLSDAEIEAQFLAYYQAKHGNKQTA